MSRLWLWLSRPRAMWKLHHLTESEKAVLRRGRAFGGRIPNCTREEMKDLENLQRVGIIKLDS